MIDNKEIKEKKKFSKGKIILLFVLIVILSGAVYAYYSLTKISYIPAQLHIQSGTVLVNGKIVNENLRLKEKDIIETKEGLATVILYESVIVNLDKNTKVSIEDLEKKHPKLNQEKGITWNTFTKLAGVEDYSIKEGSSVASVRATAFELSSGKIITGEGAVDYEIDDKFYIVEEKKVVEKLNGEIKKRDATPQELARIKEYMLSSLDELKYIRQKEIESHPIAVKLIITSLGGTIKEIKGGEVISERELTQEEIYAYLDEADKGNINVDVIVEKIPIKIAFLDKIAELTKKIQEINRRVQEL